MNSKAIFLILSLFSGIIELGGVFYSFKIGLDSQYTVIIALLYQLGNLFPVPLKLNKALLIFFNSITFFSMNLMYVYKINSWICFFIVYLLTTIIIQSLRAEGKAEVSTELKRTFRIMGFIISYLFSFKMLFIINLLTFILVFFYPKDKKFFCIYPKKINSLGKIMIYHQVHYFSYVYILLIIFYKSNQLNLLKIAIYFSISWIVYTSIPIIISSENYKKIFIFGHLYLTILLLMFFFVKNITIAIIFWTLSGIGGGTVFCIKKINKKSKKYMNNEEIIFYENIGHILGVIISLIFLIIFKNKLNYIFLFSSTFALIACFFMSKYSVSKK